MSHCFSCGSSHDGWNIFTCPNCERTGRLIASQKGIVATLNANSPSDTSRIVVEIPDQTLLADELASLKLDMIEKLESIEGFLRWSHSALILEHQKQIAELLRISDILSRPDEISAEQKKKLGEIAFARGNVKEALRLFRLDQELNPTDYCIDIDLAMCFLQSGFFDDAHISFQRAVSNAKTPDCKSKALLFLSRIEYSRGNYKQAVDYANQALREEYTLDSAYEWFHYGILAGHNILESFFDFLSENPEFLLRMIVEKDLGIYANKITNYFFVILRKRYQQDIYFMTMFGIFCLIHGRLYLGQEVLQRAISRNIDGVLKYLPKSNIESGFLNNLLTTLARKVLAEKSSAGADYEARRVSRAIEQLEAQRRQ